MDNTLYQRLLLAKIKAAGSAKLTVRGNSMYPILHENDTIEIAPSGNYVIGDILVYLYKEGSILVHRLLKIDNNKFYCKGDNSFRLEDITFEQIIGKVIKINNSNVIAWKQDMLELSYHINRLFVKNKYDRIRTQNENLYKHYQNTVLEGGKLLMTYLINEKLDYIQTDDTTLVIFDASNDNTYFFNDVGMDIIKILYKPHTYEELLKELKHMYLSTTSMETDINNFLSEAISHNIIIVS